jgi:MFS family permease
MGHIGDQFGRKRVLIFTLPLMGASTFLAGCLPTYTQVGVLAPVLLVILRMSGMAIPTQIGFALGGFAPTIAAAVQGSGPTAWVPVAFLTFGATLVAAIAAWTAPETYNVHLYDLGNPTALGVRGLPAVS